MSSLNVMPNLNTRVSGPVGPIGSNGTPAKKGKMFKWIMIILVVLVVFYFLKKSRSGSRGSGESCKFHSDCKNKNCKCKNGKAMCPRFNKVCV